MMNTTTAADLVPAFVCVALIGMLILTISSFAVGVAVAAVGVAGGIGCAVGNEVAYSMRCRAREAAARKSA